MKTQSATKSYLKNTLGLWIDVQEEKLLYFLGCQNVLDGSPQRVFINY